MEVVFFLCILAIVGMRIPSSLSNSAYKKATHIRSISTTLPIIPLDIGKPFQRVFVLLDTGALKILVNSALCKERICRMTSRYTPSASSNYKSLNRKGVVVFVDMAGNFVFGKDRIRVGKYTLNNVVIGSLISNKRKLPVFNFLLQGILGLGTSQNGRDNSLQILRKVGVKSISFYHPAIPTMTKVPIVSFGRSSQCPGNPQHYVSSQLHYHKVVATPFWIIRIQSVAFGTEPLDLCTKNCLGLVDTGSSALGIPQKYHKNFLKFLQFRIKNNSGSHHPDLVYKIDGLKYKVPSSNYILNGEIMIRGISIKAKSKANVYILGLPFLRSYFSHFDIEGKRVGFAPNS